MNKVFISHPFQDNPEENLSKTKSLLSKLRREYPEILFISPLHLFSYFKQEVQNFRADIIEFCKHLLDNCDEIWLYGKSDGCMEEAQYAKEIGVKVVWK